jgi:hypothetical protein
MLSIITLPAVNLSWNAISTSHTFSTHSTAQKEKNIYVYLWRFIAWTDEKYFSLCRHVFLFTFFCVCSYYLFSENTEKGVDEKRQFFYEKFRIKEFSLNVSALKKFHTWTWNFHCKRTAQNEREKGNDTQRVWIFHFH